MRSRASHARTNPSSGSDGNDKRRRRPVLTHELAVETYILSERKGVTLEPGKH
jgi:hypothetical protein